MKKLSLLLLVVFSVCASNLYAQQPTSKKSDTTKQQMKYACPMKCEGDKTYSSEGKCPKCKMNLKAVKADSTKQDAKFACPMKCEGDKTYAEAGKCPKCKMNLKEVKKEHNHNH